MTEKSGLSLIQRKALATTWYEQARAAAKYQDVSAYFVIIRNILGADGSFHMLGITDAEALSVLRQGYQAAAVKAYLKAESLMGMPIARECVKEVRDYLRKANLKLSDIGLKEEHLLRIMRVSPTHIVTTKRT